MTLLIDGYNLLHVTGLFGKGGGPGSFQRSREALLRFLAASLEPAERMNTTIVFDANDAPPGLPQEHLFEEITVRYARDYSDADALIEELIQRDNAPRSLLVVSSDHRIQRAARRRRAQNVDSDVWYSRLWQQRVQTRRGQHRPHPEKPIGELSEAEIDYWVNEFLRDDVPPENRAPADGPNPDEPKQQDSLQNLFPPGYGQDLFDDHS